MLLNPVPTLLALKCDVCGKTTTPAATYDFLKAQSLRFGWVFIYDPKHPDAYHARHLCSKCKDETEMQLQAPAPRTSKPKKRLKPIS